MPRDQRLYMTFPIDFPDHPKVKPLSLGAKWAFVEMNAYSRRMGLDGVIPVPLALSSWSKKVLTELVDSHPERPLVLLKDGAYVIRDYSEHQLTEADIDDLREKRAQAGAAGGRAKAAKQAGSKGLASATAIAKQNGGNSLAESESESELLTDVTKDYESGHLGDAPEIDSDAIALARTAGITDLASVRSALARAVDAVISPRGAVELTQAIVSKAARHVRNVDAYVATTCRNSPAEVQQAYFDLDIEGLAP